MADSGRGFAPLPYDLPPPPPPVVGPWQGDVQARLDELTVPSGRERSLAKG